MKIQIVSDGFALVAESFADKLKIRRIENAKYPNIKRTSKFQVKDISFAVQSFENRGFYVYHRREKVH